MEVFFSPPVQFNYVCPETHAYPVLTSSQEMMYVLSGSCGGCYGNKFIMHDLLTKSLYTVESNAVWNTQYHKEIFHKSGKKYE